MTAAPMATAGAFGTSARPAVAAPAGSAKADGENVLRGLFFGQGEVGKDPAGLELFSEARKHIDDNTPEEIRASDVVVGLIDKRSPGLFADLGEKARSGDPRQVEKAVTDARNMLPAVAKDKSATPVENGRLCGATVAVGAAAVVTAAGAVVTVTVTVGANFVKAKNRFWSSEPATGDDTPLSRDEAVAQVTQALSAA
ncbi:hypothetical protein [Streptomyces sp. NEAU-W12]|uniref:hypothetical protein n=1 Tax=Streptomyces sp. NEAU-W12 TaxID=2994668 RepID=UPI00224B7416|nr:hypothetical protein [Streptomyces sp. NEAU-W12]MCX2925736.1 hypothetical protein [Streptomyces sp. NEAU-W12]